MAVARTRTGNSRKPWRVRQNLRVLVVMHRAGYVYQLAGCAVKFREDNRPRVDFYPGTGTWRDIDTGATYYGGGGAFLRWYRIQRRTKGD